MWAAATMLIQAERKDRTASAMTLPLAEKLTVKVLQEKASPDGGFRISTRLFISVVVVLVVV